MALETQNNSNNGHVEEEDEDERVKVFIGQVPREMSEDQLRPIFEEAGKVHEISLIRDKATKQSRGCCFVIYKSKQDADNAIAIFHDKRKLPPMLSHLQVKYADGELERLEHKLFVGMLPKNATEADVEAVFSKYGSIKEIMIIKGGQVSKGCGFVKYHKRREAVIAIAALNGLHKMEGSPSPLLVKWADTEKERQARKTQKSQQAVPTIGVSSVQQPAVFGALLPRYGVATPLSGYGYQAPNPYGVPSYPYSAQLNIGTTPTGAAGPATMATGYNNPMQGLGSGYMGSASAFASHPAAGMFQGNLPVVLACQLPMYTGIGLSTADTPDVNGAVGSQAQGGPAGANLFIYNLPAEYGDQDLFSTFAPYGSVVSAKVYVDKATGLSKCFGFVSYSSPEAAQAAIAALDGSQVGGKKMKVQLKRDDKTSKPY